MKTTLKLLAGICVMLMSVISLAQKIDEQRMERDIEVAENVLSTLLRQEFDRQHLFFPLEVEGSYQPGYGVTFRLPADFTTPMASYFFSTPDNNVLFWNDQMMSPPPMPEPVLPEMFDTTVDEEDAKSEGEVQFQSDRKIQHYNRNEDHRRDKPNKIILKQKGVSDKNKSGKGSRKMALDSIQEVNNAKVIEAAKNFLADYGDLISQLASNERIVVTNQGEQPRTWVNKFDGTPNRTHLSLEISKGDVTLYKQGKLTHDQVLTKIKIVDTETVDVIEPDIELLSSIFNRLYQQDLSHTYFTERPIYYERLKDFGVVYYMQALSSHQLSDYSTFTMPTLGLDNLDQEERDAKVKELYPIFEKELKQNMLEYGRTLRTLKDNEVFVFNVKVTKCKGCKIPSSVELSVKGSVLKDFNAGKITEAAALEKVVVKKGAEQ